MLYRMIDKSDDIMLIDKEGLSMSIGKNIKILRKQMGMTQKQFAKRLGMQDKQLCRYEVDGCAPSVKVLKKIANFCEVSIDQIIYGKDEHFAKRTKVSDYDLLNLFRRINQMKKIKREQFKWIIASLLKDNK